ncbi:hypothetical protein GF312_01865 [Candidatus Poribacteria bacterium]|nr:hypothetical protein [Candidatus Poribacteria bacterium]
MKKEATINDGVKAFPGFPVVLVSTRDNIITVALVHRFSYNPFMLGIGIAYSRYSYELIKNEKEFIVNIPTVDLMDQVKLCGKISGRDQDKFAACGFTKVQGKVVNSSSIAQCPVSIECKLVDQLELKERVWFVGKVLAVQKEENYNAAKAVMIDRGNYLVIGEKVADR